MFWYKGEQIEIVNQNKDVIQRKNILSFEQHFHEKGRAAK